MDKIAKLRVVRNCKLEIKPGLTARVDGISDPEGTAILFMEHFRLHPMKGIYITSNLCFPRDSYLAAARSDHEESPQQYLPDLPESSVRGSKAFTNTNSHQYHGTNTRGNSQEYGLPRFRGGLSQEHGYPNLRSGTESGRKLSQDYAPSVRLSQEYDSLSSLGRSFRRLSQKQEDLNGVLSTTYNIPNGWSISQEYGVPETGAALKSSTLASSYPSTRSPSREYGAPSSRTAMPSPQYGASRNLDGYSDQSYESYARNSLELLNQVVDYEADEDGFKPRISVIPADTASSRAGDWPY
ncbi:unnamed protein product [Parnassius apollo]|uniref:(apollo) hypothetical protein n=1 Tax=Parnassius apollo TaxID=110799 RepID=A0A8S3W1S3_PARAO|nr:unnamed protein product [Parnassius apollo]